MSSCSAIEAAAALSLAHHHPGRLRLRSEAFQDDDALAARARDALAGEGAVLRVEHDAETGSLLIEYEPGRVAPDELMARAAQAAGLRLTSGDPRRPQRTQGERFVRACRELNDAAYEMTGFRVEPRTLVPIGVGLLSGVFFVINDSQRMPRWDNLAYWSISLFAMFHGGHTGAAPDLKGTGPGRPEGGAAEGPR